MRTFGWILLRGEQPLLCRTAIVDDIDVCEEAVLGRPSFLSGEGVEEGPFSGKVKWCRLAWCFAAHDVGPTPFDAAGGGGGNEDPAGVWVGPERNGFFACRKRGPS